MKKVSLVTIIILFVLLVIGCSQSSPSTPYSITILPTETLVLPTATVTYIGQPESLSANQNISQGDITVFYIKHSGTGVTGGNTDVMILQAAKDGSFGFPPDTLKAFLFRKGLWSYDQAYAYTISNGCEELGPFDLYFPIKGGNIDLRPVYCK